MKVYLLCCGPSPVGWIRHSQDSRATDECGDQHRFIPGQDCLANCDAPAGLVLARECSGTVVAVWLVGEWFFNLAVLVAVEATILFNVSTFPYSGNFYQGFLIPLMPGMSTLWP